MQHSLGEKRGDKKERVDFCDFFSKMNNEIAEFRKFCCCLLALSCPELEPRSLRETPLQNLEAERSLVLSHYSTRWGAD